MTCQPRCTRADLHLLLSLARHSLPDPHDAHAHWPRYRRASPAPSHGASSDAAVDLASADPRRECRTWHDHHLLARARASTPRLGVGDQPAAPRTVWAPKP
jgi:hypothetical protein